tara:strand:+ start:3909 stop:6443 length:2535 start_codon:yes stop_codon:yes gene_type:complete
MADYLSKGLLRSGIDNTRSLIGGNIAEQEDMFDNFSNVADKNALTIKTLDSEQKKRLKNEKLLVRQIKKDFPGIQDSLANSIAFTIGEQFIPTLSAKPTYSFGEYSTVYENSNLKGGGSYAFDVQSDNRIDIDMPKDTSFGGIDIPKVEADDTSIFKKLFTTDPRRAQSKYGKERGLTTSESAALGTIGAPLDYDPLSAYDTGTELNLIPAFEVQGGLTIGQGQAFVDKQLATYDTSFSALLASGNIVDNPDGSYSFQEKAVNDEEMRYRRNKALEQVGISGQRGPINPTLISNYIIETQPIADKYKNIEAQLTAGSATDPNSVRRIVAKYRTTVNAGGTNKQGEDLNFIKKELETTLNNRDDISDDEKDYLLKNYSSDMKTAKSSMFYTKQYNIDDYKKEIDDVSFKQSIAFRPEDLRKQEEITTEETQQDTQESDQKLTEGKLDVNELALTLNIPEEKKEGEVSINDYASRAENIGQQMEEEFVRTNPVESGALETAGKAVDEGFDTVKNKIKAAQQRAEVISFAKGLIVSLPSNVVSNNEKARRVTFIVDDINMLPEKLKERLIQKISQFVSNNQDTLGSEYVDNVTTKINLANNDDEEILAKAEAFAEGGTMSRAIPRFNKGSTIIDRKTGKDKDSDIEEIVVKGKREDDPFKYDKGILRGIGGYGGLGAYSDPAEAQMAYLMGRDKDTQGSAMMEGDLGGDDSMSLKERQDEYDKMYNYTDTMRKQIAEDAKKNMKKGIMAANETIDDRNILEQFVDVGMLGAPGSKAKIATAALTDNETINNAVGAIANVVDAPFNLIAGWLKAGAKKVDVPDLDNIPGLDKIETALDTAEDIAGSND